jgi:hypothetical protein
MTKLIGPDSLEVDAVVPQCLDNQYVSDAVFVQMRERGVDYRDRDIAAAREADFRTEFIRSLVYSSQVIIQRAFLKNSEFLYKNYAPDNGNNLQSFAQLVRSNAIVPYLYRESSLRDDLSFDVHKEGDRATKALLEELGNDAVCVRLGVDDVVNDEATAKMSSAFGKGLSGIQHIDDVQRNAMATELFADRSVLDQDGTWERFSLALDDLAEYAFLKSGKLRREKMEQFVRSHVYKDLLMVPGDQSVANGRFKRPGPDTPFLLELKKYVDLVYNTNLPDHLKRYTFTPTNMPSRIALQDLPGVGFSPEAVNAVLSDDDALESIRRTFMAHTQRAMSLPLLNTLTIEDVEQIRMLPEWAPFKKAQTNILTYPLQCLDLLGEFQRSFDEFQRALSSWYNVKYERVRTEDRYSSFISLALSIGGKLIVAGSSLNPYEKVAANTMVDQGIGYIPKTVKGYAAKLLVGVYDKGARALDASRTYSIELMQTSADLAQEDVRALLESIHRKKGVELPGEVNHLSDQGIL